MNDWRGSVMKAKQPQTLVDSRFWIHDDNASASTEYESPGTATARSQVEAHSVCSDAGKSKARRAHGRISCAPQRSTRKSSRSRKVEYLYESGLEPPVVACHISANSIFAHHRVVSVVKLGGVGHQSTVRSTIGTISHPSCLAGDAWALGRVLAELICGLRSPRLHKGRPRRRQYSRNDHSSSSGPPPED
jgi:hypothetical protein